MRLLDNLPDLAEERFQSPAMLAETFEGPERLAGQGDLQRGPGPPIRIRQGVAQETAVVLEVVGEVAEGRVDLVPDRQARLLLDGADGPVDDGP